MDRRKGIACLLALIGATLGAAAGPVDSLRAVVDAYPTNPVVGFWQIAGDGAILAVTPQAAGGQRFDVHLIESPDMSLPSGLRCGTLRLTAVAGTYDGALRIDPRTSDRRRRTADCTFRLLAPGRMAINTYRRTKQLSLWRVVPYLFRVGIVDKTNRPADLDGALRIYPPTPGATHTVL